MKWRLIDTDLADPYYVTAADEVILQTVKDKKILNTLHFYRRNPPGISVGRSRIVDDDVDVCACHNNGVKIVRRASGGGTIFTDEGCLIYALTLRDFDKTDYAPIKTFQKVCSVIINTLNDFGIDAEYKSPNDVLLNKKKISGSAQIKKGNTLLVHGTILIYTDLELMRRVLKNVNSEYVSTISDECDTMPSVSDVKEKLKHEFECAFNVSIEPSSFTFGEQKLINRLVDEKYGKDEWNFRR